MFTIPKVMGGWNDIVLPFHDISKMCPSPDRVGDIQIFSAVQSMAAQYGLEMILAGNWAASLQIYHELIFDNLAGN